MLHSLLAGGERIEESCYHIPWSCDFVRSMWNPFIDVFGIQCARHKGYKEIRDDGSSFFTHLLVRRGGLFLARKDLICVVGFVAERGMRPLEGLSGTLLMFGPLTGSIFHFGH